MTAVSQISRSTLSAGDVPVLYSLLVVCEDHTKLEKVVSGFRHEPYYIKATTSGFEALGWARQSRPDVMICSLSMQDPAALDLLQGVEEVSPLTGRIGITEDAEPHTLLNAINRGRVQRLLSMNDDQSDNCNVVAELACLCGLARAKDELTDALGMQIDHLGASNHELNQAISHEKAQLGKTQRALAQAESRQKLGLVNAVQSMTRLIEQQSPALMSHSYRVAALAREIARQLKLPLASIREIHMAALLHDLGKVGFARQLIDTPLALLNGEDRYLLQQHPERGQRSIAAVPDLLEVAKLVRFHHERFDGHGFPDGIMREMIPLGSRIIAVAEDYDELKLGWLTENALSEAQALDVINRKSGTRYDPQVVAVLKNAIYRLKTSPQPGEAVRNASNLKSGMVLSRDLLSPDGLLIQLKDKEVTDTLIDHISNLEKKTGQPMRAYVKQWAY